jgi:2-polyprenyl-3-methyl-5-hydroxy-6-metoxy-1,4-benzoquinol methylase
MGVTDHQELALKKFIGKVRGAVIGQNPARQEHFDIYANEAIFGLSIIKDDLSTLPRDATVLEVGAGALLLSGYLASLGLRVYALEPIAAGFSHFHELQGAVVKHYATIGVQLKLIESTIEEFFDTERFDYIFSINAFEHVRDVEQAITNTYLSLKHGGALRIYCPNYHFPYEPHFNIPTLISKKLTEYVFGNFILTSSRMPQPKETWEGLNWINVTQVSKFLSSRFGNSPKFNSLATFRIFTRAIDDVQFSERRSRWVNWVLRAIHHAGLMNLFRYLPIKFSPVMDFRLERVPVKG